MGSDLRLGDYIKSGLTGNSIVQILGFPSDEGVRINGGRPGSSKAPALIFEQLMKLTPHAGHQSKHTNLLEKTTGLKICNCTGNVENDQNVLGEEVSSLLNNETFSIIIGGGHETSFGHFLGYAKNKRKVSVINIDAHTDVRGLKNGKPHSGSPFRQALEHLSGSCASYNVFGLNPASVSKEHFEYVSKHGSAVFEQDFSKENVEETMEKCENNILVTMDMDAVNQSQAPGVSAPNASGIKSALWLELAFEFGKNPAVSSFDLCEVNPDFDRDNQTVKLAALTIWYFMLGLSLRE